MRSPRNFIDFGMSGCPENAISVHKERHRPFSIYHLSTIQVFEIAGNQKNYFEIAGIPAIAGRFASLIVTVGFGGHIRD